MVSTRPVVCEATAATGASTKPARHSVGAREHEMASTAEARTKSRNVLTKASVTPAVLARGTRTAAGAPAGAARPLMPFRHVLVATDFSECSSAAIEHAVDVTRHYRATLALVHAFELHYP